MAKKVAFVIVILIGIALRLYQVHALPGGFFIDEVAMAVDAKSLVENGTDQYGRRYPFGFEDLTDYKLPGYLYAAAAGYMLFGNELISIRLPSILASLTGIALLWYFTKSLFPSRRELPYFTAGALSLCYYHIHFGRIAYETMLATTFFTVYLIALTKIIKTRAAPYWYGVGGIALIICMWTYPGIRFIIPVFTLLLIIACYALKPNGIKLQRVLRAGGFFLTLAVLTFIPSFLNRSLDKRPVSYILIDETGTWYEIIISKFFRTISSWIRMFNFEYLFSLGDTFAFRHGTRETGVYPPIFAIPFLTGIWYYIRQFSKKSFAFLFLGLLTIVIGFPSAVTSDTPYGPRLLAITIPFSIFIGLGAEHLVTVLQKRKRRVRKIVYGAFSLLLLFQVGYFAHVYFVHFPQKSFPEFPVAPVTLAKLIEKERTDNPDTPIYFLNGWSCRQWSHDDLQIWYFADLPNDQMIRWNNIFRGVRYKAQGSPFDAYDNSEQPRYAFGKFIMNAKDPETDVAPEGSLIIRCGERINELSEKKERIERIIYMYDDLQQDPYYIISRKE